jgi:arylformamidase
MCATVYREYDQAELDRQFEQRAWAPNADEVIARYAAASDAARARLGEPLSFAYGEMPRETLDVYRTPALHAPLHVFIHGGRWTRLSKRESAFQAETFVRAGAHFIALDFAPLPEVTLDVMVRQVRQALAWLHRNAAAFGGDGKRLHISGHSSGGHLAACALITDWREFGVPAAIVSSALCISGIYDLRPVRLSARGSYVRLDDRMEHELSPQRHVRRIGCPVVVAYAAGDSDEFRRQSRDFAAALTGASAACRVIEGSGLNHFEIAETLAEPEAVLARIAVTQMGLAHHAE